MMFGFCVNLHCCGIDTTWPSRYIIISTILESQCSSWRNLMCVHVIGVLPFWKNRKKIDLLPYTKADKYQTVWVQFLRFLPRAVKQSPPRITQYLVKLTKKKSISKVTISLDTYSSFLGLHKKEVNPVKPLSTSSFIK